jgi:hypothetical protein
MLLVSVLDAGLGLDDVASEGLVDAARLESGAAVDDSL